MRASRPVVDLTVGPRVLTGLASGQVDRFPVSLLVGTFVRWNVEQQGADVALVLRDPQGRSLLSVDRPIGARGVEWVSWVAQRPGSYTLEVHGPARGGSGGYRIFLEGPRRARAGDREAVRAGLLHAAGVRSLAALAEASDLERWRLLEAARPPLEAALAHWRRAHDRRGVAVAEAHLGACLLGLGELARARETLEAAIPRLEEEGERVLLARALVDLGETRVGLGEEDLVREPLERAVEAARRAGESDAWLRARTLLAVSAVAAGRFEEGLQLLLDGLSRAQALRLERREAELLTRVGEVYLRMGNPPQAVLYLEEARRLDDGHGGPRWLTLERLGEAHLALGDAHGALRELEGALARLAPGSSRARGHLLHRKACALQALAQTQEARLTYQRASAILTATGDAVGAREVELDLAGLELDSGDDAGAHRRFLRLLGELETRGDSRQTVDAAYGLARALAAEGQVVAAQVTLEGALQRVETMRDGIDSPVLAEVFGASKNALFRFAVELWMQRHASDPGAGYDRRALRAVERGRSWGWLRSLADSQGRGMEQVARALLVERRRVLDGIQALTWSWEAGREASEEERRRLILLYARLDVLEGRIRAAAGGARPRLPPLIPTLEEAQTELLDTDTRLVVYSLGVERSFAFVLGPQSFRSQVLASEREIAVAAERARVGVAASRERTGRVEAAASLRALAGLILSPVAGDLRARRVVLVLDGVLQYVPFSALPFRDPLGGESSLIFERELVEIPSLTFLRELRRRSRAASHSRNRVVVFADPVLSLEDPRWVGKVFPRPRSRRPRGLGQSLEVFSRLPYAAEEAAAIRHLLPGDGTHVYEGFEARRQTVLETAFEGFAVAHFAVHGWVDALRPERSGLILSLLTPRGRLQEEVLALRDIAELRLPVDLVVLSACDTGLGQPLRGEGLVGLTRAFFQAGASRAVATLWTVQDQATARLMESFYRNLLVEGLSPPAALRRAQIEVARQTSWRGAYYWSGFILQGDWR